MTTVILYGKNGNKIADEICGMLKPYGIARATRNKLVFDSDSPSFLLFECNDIEKINIPQGILVIVGNVAENSELKIKGNFRGVFFSSDKDALQLLKNTDVSVITCGMAEEDTLSLSSIKEDSVNICINRKIKTLNGNIIEPQEHKINLKSPITDYSLLAASAILLCSGEL